MTRTIREEVPRFFPFSTLDSAFLTKTVDKGRILSAVPFQKEKSLVQFLNLYQFIFIYY